MAELEEKLREAACFGDIEGVKELLSRGVNVNAQHDINGWTSLHWAAKRNHLNIVNLLCNHGADKNIPTNKGEVAAQLTSEGVIKVLLNAMKGSAGTGGGGSTPKQPLKKEKEEKLPITPNYIRHPPLAYEVDLGDKEKHNERKSFSRPEKRPKLNNHERLTAEYESPELILKVRTAGAREQDYIEIELARDALTLEYLIVMGCEELGIQSSEVEKLRKMPNTRLRRDKEVERLEDYQEIEFVLREQDYQAEIQVCGNEVKVYNVMMYANHLLFV
ncbi:ankyrin repeat domain-containing protein 40 [Eurytemora carolleeae]|uniref:ankyrin repeat domain-containing protein 40 n=1 Tax=Eurytemora carolleeae TaxID=1294199 RepID=UPI000C78FC6C|nr:ankyrin repeat domain-containing protein 40 [Eurytemora carolleeae]|eukprot:XP_023343823.1 ankyrin repeat domain-containing protein 40-like [Eurytemora affinis]